MKDEIGEVHPCSFILRPFGCEGLEGGGLVELLDFESSAGGEAFFAKATKPRGGAVGEEQSGFGFSRIW